MYYTLRPAGQQDSAAIHSLIYKVQINPLGLDWRRFVVAASLDGRLLGCGQIKPLRDGSYELASIAVQPECQGQGLGRAIVEQLLDSHSGELYLTCRPELERYYEKFGFIRAAGDGLPRYFRRIRRLARVLSLGGRLGEWVLVMKRG